MISYSHVYESIRTQISLPAVTVVVVGVKNIKSQETFLT